jgi:hypothetical protein
MVKLWWSMVATALRCNCNILKPTKMKKLSFLLIIAAGLIVAACSEKKSERFILLTTPVWVSDSLYADGVNASGAGQLLEKFVGDAKFNEDGTGYFGQYKGKWMLGVDEDYLTITSDSLKIPIIADIDLLTATDLKITTKVPNPVNLSNPFDIRMTFKAK